MPTLIPPGLSLKHFPTRKLPKDGQAKIPPRVRSLVHLMALGTPDGAKPAMTLKEAAAEMNIRLDTAQKYFRSPLARSAYLQLCRDMRESEIARNTTVAAGIRDRGAEESSAAHRRNAIEAMKFLEGANDHRSNSGGGAPTVMPGVVVTINVDSDAREVDPTIIEVNPVPVREANGA